ncbi:prolyl 4-hydroxylase subunit alpha-2-like [Panulirus ornatus]|uniref:prolyl 4-hydroxylase subunit alpha-2-like n=1 Tax=Panulirus ornatus TaxID=150431 RepID=UPI003A893EEF
MRAGWTMAGAVGVVVMMMTGVVMVGGMSVDDVARARSLDTVIVEHLRHYLHRHQQEQHLLQRHQQQELLRVTYHSRLARYIEEYDNLLAGKHGSRRHGPRDGTGGRMMKEEENEGTDPVEGLLVSRRLVRDWHRLREAPLGDSWQEVVSGVAGAEVGLGGVAGSREQLAAMTHALMRVHHVYRLHAPHLARGRLHHHHDKPLRAADVAGVGVAALENGLYGRAAEWFTAAHDAHQEEGPERNGTRTHLDILLHLATAAHDYKLSQEGFANQPGIYPRPLSQVPVAEQLLKARQQEEREEQQQQERGAGSDLTTTTSISATPRDELIYSRLCRGHTFMSAREASQLKCRVDRRGSAWLTLMPALVEEHSLDPPILSFHHVLSDHQLAVIRHLALPLLEQAKVQDSNKGEEGSPIQKHRSSYTAWLPAHAHPTLRAASRMVAAITGLEVSEERGEAEMLQVNQYGNGAHYDPHMDFLALYHRIWEAEQPDEKLIKQHPNGDRIATLMFYMNDVEEGGRTVFPRVGVGVEPRRGSAVFWWNLLPCGRGDVRMLHAACPVLRGTKWVSNKWIKSYPQLHHRPCLPLS